VNAATLLARVRAHLTASSDRRRLEGMFRDVIEYAPVAFLLTDLSGKLVTVNAHALACFGVSRAEMLNSPLARWIPDIGGRVGTGTSPAHAAQFETDCRRADGSAFPADITVGNLRSTKQALDLFIVRNIEERRRTFQELQDSRTRLREMGAQNESARENERKHLAREVHDELGQVMTALRIDLSMMEMRYHQQMPELNGKIGAMKVLVDRAIAGVRQIAGNLRPPALDMGLAAAIEWLVAEFKQHSTAQVRLELQGLQDPVLEDRAMTIYRIVQESLNNITKYANASEVHIALRRTGATLDLSVKDNGAGFDPLQPSGKRSFGLLGMRERALSIGGELDIDSQIGQGTHVHAQFPLGLEKGPRP
jgi:PAS domain S-box-containing protein